MDAGATMRGEILRRRMRRLVRPSSSRLVKSKLVDRNAVSDLAWRSVADELRRSGGFFGNADSTSARSTRGHDVGVESKSNVCVSHGADGVRVAL